MQHAAGDVVVGGLGEMQAVPGDVPGRLHAQVRRRGVAVAHQRVGVVGPTHPTARPQNALLREPCKLNSHKEKKNSESKSCQRRHKDRMIRKKKKFYPTDIILNILKLHLLLPPS